MRTVELMSELSNLAKVPRRAKKQSWDHTGIGLHSFISSWVGPSLADVSVCRRDLQQEEQVVPGEGLHGRGSRSGVSA